MSGGAGEGNDPPLRTGLPDGPAAVRVLIDAPAVLAGKARWVLTTLGAAAGVRRVKSMTRQTLGHVSGRLAALVASVLLAACALPGLPPPAAAAVVPALPGRRRRSRRASRRLSGG